MKSLPISLDNFGFVQREKDGSKVVKNKCGRDFLYYSLHYYFPNKFNPKELNPEEIEKGHFFGLKLPFWLMWTGLQFLYLPKCLKENNLSLFINNKQIKSFFGFVWAFFTARISCDNALDKVEKAVDEKTVAGIDLGLGYGGLYDHIIFVFGYDQEALYVFDTHKVPTLEYTKLTEDNRYFMRLPRDVIGKRWTKFGRIWEVKTLQETISPVH